MTKLSRGFGPKLYIFSGCAFLAVMLTGCDLTPEEPVLLGDTHSPEPVARGMAGAGMAAPEGQGGGQAAAMAEPAAMAQPNGAAEAAAGGAAAAMAAPQGQRQGQQGAGGRDLSSVAAAIGRSEEDIRAALAAAGGPPPDLAAASQALGVSQQALRTALQAARGGAEGAGGMAGPNGMTRPNGMAPQ